MATPSTALNFPSSGTAGEGSKLPMNQVVIAGNGATIIHTTGLSQKIGSRI